MSEASGLYQGYLQSSNNAPASLSCSAQTPSLIPTSISHSLQAALHLVLKRTENMLQTCCQTNSQPAAHTTHGISVLGSKLGCSLQQFWSSFLFLICYEFSFIRRLFMDICDNPSIFWLYYTRDEYSVSGTHRQHHSRGSHTSKRWAQRDYEPNNPRKHFRNIPRGWRVPVMLS